MYGQSEPTFVPKEKIVFDGKRMRQTKVHRRFVDSSSGMALYVKDSRATCLLNDAVSLQPHSGFRKYFYPPQAYLSSAVSSVTTKFIHLSVNKTRSPVNTLKFSPAGRRCITGCSSGEFTLWNGQSFNFETILQAHDSAIRTMTWSHNEEWMVTGDQGGEIKYWQSNMNNVKVFVGHESAVRDLKFSRTDQKMITCSDEKPIKIWDFATTTEEGLLEGHLWDVKCVDWHPLSSLVVSGSKDNLIKLWDAKSYKNVATLHGHKNTVVDVEFNQNGNWLLTAARDQLIKLYDIRMMKELQSFRGHKKEVTSLAWHPVHEDLFVSGGFDGSILFWDTALGTPQGAIESAHESAIWSLDWHPVGHVLASGAHDHTTKFWCRQRLGEKNDPRFHVSEAYVNHYDPDAEKPDELYIPEAAQAEDEETNQTVVTVGDTDPFESLPGLDTEFERKKPRPPSPPRNHTPVPLSRKERDRSARQWEQERIREREIRLARERERARRVEVERERQWQQAMDERQRYGSRRRFHSRDGRNDRGPAGPYGEPDYKRPRYDGPPDRGTSYGRRGGPPDRNGPPSDRRGPPLNDRRGPPDRGPPPPFDRRGPPPVGPRRGTPPGDRRGPPGDRRGDRRGRGGGRGGPRW